jgi:Icc-related predicted phosphoesterase
MGLFRRGGERRLLKLYVASDLHGSTACFSKFLQAPEHYGAETLLIAGDLTGKMVVPVVKNGSGYVSRFHGLEHRVAAEDLPAHEREIDAAGMYAYRTTQDEMEALAADRAGVDRIFHRLVLERVERWLSMGEEKLAAAGRRCYLVPGNDDYPEVDDLLRQGERMQLVDGTVARIDDEHEIAGLGVSNVTPWHAPRDLPETDIAERLEALEQRIEDPERAILMIHVPPKDSAIDLAPQLDDELRPVGLGGGMVGVGSSAVRDAIERMQPLLTVHGHIHESPGIARIGRTTCVNPGSEYSQSILRGALVNLAADKVAGHLFVTG